MAASSDFEWLNMLIAAASAAIGVLGGLIAGTWRVARIEPQLRLDINQNLAGIENDLRDQIAAGEQRIGDKITEAVQILDDTHKALRQKISDVELDVAKNYVNRANFDDFRKEYREDMKDLKEQLLLIQRARR